ncbi:hypothetical protein KJ966_10465 [bacterium]|nr:hypothetical protein [bacterium]
MAKDARRGPKKGKRLTLEVQAEIIIEALYSKRTILEVIDAYKKKGYNIKDEVDIDLKNLGTTEMTFMLANKQILETVKEDAIKSIINNITKPKKGTPAV